jgi:hypothetical protein
MPGRPRVIEPFHAERGEVSHRQAGYEHRYPWVLCPACAITLVVQCTAICLPFVSRPQHCQLFIAIGSRPISCPLDKYFCASASGENVTAMVQRAGQL